MYRWKKGLLLSLLLFWIPLMLTGWVVRVESQDKYPDKAIDIVVPVPPGGGADLFSRVTADFLKKKWGVSVHVVNKPGGGTVIGAQEVYKAAPDGYTILSDAPLGDTMLEITIKDLPFKVLDRTFIASVVRTPYVFYVPSTSPSKSLKDVEADAKRDPSHFTWGLFGGAGPADFPSRQFFKAIGLDISKTKPVSIRGGAETLTLLAGGHIKLGVSSPASGLPHISAGTVRVVAVTGYRAPQFPEIPTAVEQGYPTVTAVSYYGFSGPPKLSPHIVAKWEEALQEMLKTQAFVSKLKTLDQDAFYINSHDLREFVKHGMEEAAKLWGLK
jgi:tripartite-type tricarboxylate transporter receptor subunit TctC